MVEHEELRMHDDLGALASSDIRPSSIPAITIYKTFG